jgi:hypothetical protein
MDHIFLYQRWLHKRLHDYVTSAKPPQLRGKDIALPTSQYGAALMQAYLGKASLRWVADLSCISLELLREWRQQPRFLLVMDWSKALFSKAFQEDLALNDYTEVVQTVVSILSDPRATLAELCRKAYKRRVPSSGQRRGLAPAR